MTPHGSMLHLRRDGTSVVLDLTKDVPGIAHWGTDLGHLQEKTLVAMSRGGALPPQPGGIPVGGTDGGLVPQAARGHLGVPLLEGHRHGRDHQPWFRLHDLDVERAEAADRVALQLVDDAARLNLRLDLELGAGGLLRLRAAITNAGADPYQVDALVPQVPVPALATELSDDTGRWTRERSPQRHPFVAGTHERVSRTARGHDAPLVFAAGEPGFSGRHGRVWAVHLGWPGATRLVADHRMPTGGRALGGGAFLLPGEGRLAPGDTMTSPWLYASHGTGLDEVSGRFHDWLRARRSHPRSPRPVLLNVWEAVYFDHDLDRLRELATIAAGLGIERLVLDDGWFLGRRDDTAGLGDWVVDPDVWPDGLGPLVDHVRDLGMDFGIWVEPEMISPDSDLARAHPDWILQTPGREPLLARNQAVLDLGNPAAYDHVLARLDALLSDHAIAAVKWDHNRALVDAGSPATGTPGVLAQTAATLRLLATLRDRHPAVEFESCASGGGRADLGIMGLADRVWASDTIDALERQQIDLGTMRLLPPELVGSHVGASPTHTTGRTHDLDFRATTALFGHMGVEWDLATATPGERARLAEWIQVHKDHRDLLHGGRMVEADHPDPALRVHGVVSHDHDEAIFAIVQLATSVAAASSPVRLPGLDPVRTYRTAALGPGEVVPDWGARGTWWPGPIELTGRVLSEVGLQPPVQFPERSLLVHLRATT